MNSSIPDITSSYLQTSQSIYFMFALKLFFYFPFIWQECSIWWCFYSVLKPNSNHCIERLKWIVLDLPLCWIDFFIFYILFVFEWTETRILTHVYKHTHTYTQSHKHTQYQHETYNNIKVTGVFFFPNTCLILTWSYERHDHVIWGPIQSSYLSSTDLHKQTVPELVDNKGN